MAGFTERISVLIDVTVDRANKGIKDFRTAVSEAEGVTGKLKAGVSSLGSAFGAAASHPAVMGGAVAAAGAAAFKAAEQYAELGIEVGKLAESTGLTTEAASRWLEVAGDLGVDVGALETSLGKLNKTIDPDKFAKLGIQIERTASGAVDVNGTFLNVIDRLNGMNDPAEKARVATELLGRGWQNMSELIGAGSTSLKKSLADVADVKVFDKKDVAQAREFREMIDNLKDVGEELALEIGQELLPMVVALGKAAAVAAKGAGYLLDAMDELANSTSAVSGKEMRDILAAVEDVGAAFYDTDFAVRNGIKSYEDLWGQLRLGEVDIADAQEALDGLTGTHIAHFNEVDRGADMIAEFGTVMRGTSKDVRDDTDALDDARRATADLKAATDSLLGTLDQQDAWDRYAEALWRANDGVDTSERETRDLIRAQVDLINTMDDIPDEQKVALITQLEQGDVDTVNAWLTQWAKGVNVPVRFKGQGNVGWMKDATGTSWSPGGATLVGEQGPEIINMPRGASVVPAGRAQQMRQRGLGGGAQIGTLIVQTNDQPRRWFDEALWRVAG